MSHYYADLFYNQFVHTNLVTLGAEHGQNKVYIPVSPMIVEKTRSYYDEDEVKEGLTTFNVTAFYVHKSAVSVSATNVSYDTHLGKFYEEDVTLDFGLVRIYHKQPIVDTKEVK